MKRLFFLVTFVLAGKSVALLPPLTFMLREVFDGRRPMAPIEMILKHRIDVRGEKIEIEERLLRERGVVHILWRVPGVERPIPVSWEKQSYIVTRDRTFPSRSAVFMKYLLFDSPEEFRDTLVTEQFIRRDQLFQYKPGYIPTGDPQTWALKDNYMKHPDIFLSRLPRGIGIAVVGLDDATNRRAIFFTQPKKSEDRIEGVQRVEWREGAQTVAWNFEQFAHSSDGTYPRSLSFEFAGSELVSTQVISWRPLRDRALTDFRTIWKSTPRPTSLPPAVEGALKLLLSYR